MHLDFHAVRSIAPGVVVSECTTQFKRTANSPAVPGRCQLVCSHEAGQWRIASLREIDAPAEQLQHHAKVSQLEWLVGEWIGEGPNFQVHFSCRWDQSGSYLLRDFKVETGGHKPLTGTQRIGYDALTKQLKIWVFDSAGGFSEGTFEREEDAWVVRTTGVTPEGQAASSVNTLKRIDDHRLSTATVDRVVGGDRTGATEAMTLIRKPNRTMNHAAGRDVSAKTELYESESDPNINRK